MTRISFQPIRRLFQAIRLREVTLMSGFFLAGGVFGITEWKEGMVEDSILVVMLVITLIASIYLFNAWGGKESDIHNARLSALQKISPDVYLAGSLILLLVPALLGFLIRPELAVCVILVFLLWVLYSFPRIGLKNYPYLGSVLHFVAQVVHFNMVYWVFHPLSIRSLLLSLYFSLLFAGGHQLHESIDYESDRKSAIQTSAVRRGQRRSDRLSLVLFTVAAMYWFVLFLFRFTILFEMLIFTAAYALHLLSFLWLTHTGRNGDEARLLYRSVYRTIYLLAGTGLVIYRFIILAG